MEIVMTGTVIFMVVIGFILIIISYTISEKLTSGSDNDLMYDDYYKEQLENMQGKIDKILDDKADECIDKTDDKLSEMSNEKIMAVHEYSQQVLDKIDQNHNEVVFLYDMLNNKEQELKDTIRQVNNAKKTVVKEGVIIDEDAVNDEAKSDNASLASEDENTTGQNTVSKKSEKKKAKDNKDEVTQDDDDVISMLDMDDYNEFVEQNNNEQILKMYESGRSVIDISRELGIGQGEVKLVINLYKGMNRN